MGIRRRGTLWERDVPLVHLDYKYMSLDVLVVVLVLVLYSSFTRPLLLLLVPVCMELWLVLASHSRKLGWPIFVSVDLPAYSIPHYVV